MSLHAASGSGAPLLWYCESAPQSPSFRRAPAYAGAYQTFSETWSPTSPSPEENFHSGARTRETAANAVQQPATVVLVKMHIYRVSSCEPADRRSHHLCHCSPATLFWLYDSSSMSSRGAKRQRTGVNTGRKVEEPTKVDSSSSDEEEDAVATTSTAPKTPFAFNGRDTSKRVIVVLERAGLETVKTKKVGPLAGHKVGRLAVFLTASRHKRGRAMRYSTRTITTPFTGSLSVTLDKAGRILFIR